MLTICESNCNTSSVVQAARATMSDRMTASLAAIRMKPTLLLRK
jgi:hypothetical protein